MKLTQVTIDDDFWNYYRRLVRTQMIPYQWRVLNDQEAVANPGGNSYDAQDNSHAIRNLRRAAGIEAGGFAGMWFQDSDVYKWLEAAAYSLQSHADPALQRQCDAVVALIAAAQEDDGYLDTYFQLEAPDRKLKHVARSHELYCMGHYIEAGCAYYEATGSEQALAIAVKMADYLAAHFGPEPGKLHGYPGHPEVELALTRLYSVTGDRRHLDLALYMLNQRGTTPNFFAEQARTTAVQNEPYWNGDWQDLGYFQADVPLAAMPEPEGHAVRMLYLLAGAARAGRLGEDKALLAACRRLAGRIIDHQMYVTGGVGQTVNGEAFTFPDDLPNATAYAETCASCAMVFFLQAMLEAAPNGEYADVIERELFNGMLAGVALDGAHFFYVNPLEVNPTACRLDPAKRHVLPTRPAWLNCACCPPNLARLVASLDRYVYLTRGERLEVNQYVGGTATLDNGATVTQTGGYPWRSGQRFTVAAPAGVTFTLAMRIPAWATGWSLAVDGQPVPAAAVAGYAAVAVQNGSVVALTLPLAARRVYANPAVRADIGLVAVARGPIVYCLEQVDNGPQLPWLALPQDAELTAAADATTFALPLVRLTAPGLRLPGSTAAVAAGPQPQPLAFIPYFAWANRAVGEMSVWLQGVARRTRA
ncbi:glycoside hydrolase family 127 protein [Lacticaseibacillus parakribbianus]|uniref:glycoside hydrolase family 127 protein n=1 Tax=Lacticaseibacillus parakribbianus TaxID=2970927 RepID=UPI0021CB396D|nr:beta-L-arabinofuranosidase domain-containing protein [Lacticaseibacillus parakribbianus]